MALREYTDRNGIRWMVWSVSSEALHPANRNEEFLRQFASGWLCFESAKGEKRRLIEYPEGWETLPDDHLEALGKLAAPRVSRTPSGVVSPADRDASAAAETEEHDAAEAALASAEFVERRRRGLAPPSDHPNRRWEDRAR